MVFAMSVSADTFEDLQTTGAPNPVESASAVFLPVHDGDDTSGWAFMMQGGLPSENDPLPVADLWALEEGTWIELSAPAPRVSGHVMVACGDGRAYSFGGVGFDEDLRDLDTVISYEIRRIDGNLDVAIEEIHVPGPNPGACTDAAAVAIGGGLSVLHIGGFCNWNVLDDGSREVWEYRIDANEWRRRADMPIALSGHSAVVHRDQVWVFGGDGGLLRYDPGSDTWTEVPQVGPRPEVREHHGAAVVGDSMVVFGGIDGRSMPPETLRDVWQFDFTDLVWERKSDLPHGLARMVLDVVPSELNRGANVEVLIAGGVIDEWSFPHPLSDSTIVYRSDVVDTRDTFAVPAVARVHGSGAFFTSTIHMFNSGDTALELALTFTPRQGSGGRVTTVGHTVLPGVMQTIEDPLTSVFGLAGGKDRIGSLLIGVLAGSPEDLMIQTVVSARLEEGEEYGQLFPAMREAEAVRAGGAVHLNTTEDATTNRVNVGLMALADDTRVTVTPMSPLGTALAIGRSFEIDLGGNAQINDIHDAFGMGSMPNVMIEVRVERGKALAYASVLDGNGSYLGTSDPTTILPISEGSDHVTLLEIGSIRGGNEFSGSASITNHSGFAAELTADFYQRGVPGIATSTRLTIAAGETEGYSDLAGEMFGVYGDVGTVVLQSLNAAKISATGREFAILRDESGNRTGTAGQLISGATVEDCLTPGRGWHFIGLRQADIDFGDERSHLAVFNPNPEDVSVTVSLFNGIDGAAEGSRTWTVRTGELIQINNLITRINADSDDQEKRIEVVVSGQVHMNVFRVNPWGDPVTVQAFRE
jgi:hypothetical protein